MAHRGIESDLAIEEGVKSHALLIEKLLQPAAWPWPVTAVNHIETHISTVLLTGDYAYKIKKPVDLGFLDFTTLQKRKHYCEEELRLNGRLAPQIYLDVVPITGTPESPRIEGEGPAIEYAVKMNQFRPDALLSNHLSLLSVDLMDRMAALIAGFHAGIAGAVPDETYGSSEYVLASIERNFAQIRSLVQEQSEMHRLDRLEHWVMLQYQKLQRTLEQRRTDGFIRECHGDMHLGNIALVDDEIIIFDGIEFNPWIRWIDLINEIAFLVMDLDEKGRPDLGQRFLNSYLDHTGDYAGLAVMRLYLLHRAIVRAMVAAIRLSQADLPQAERSEVMAEYQAYMQQAEAYTKPRQPALIITRGVSGSGKSVATLPLVGELPAIRIRSDVERKRMAGLDARARTHAGVDQALYSKATSDSTYARLLELAEEMLYAGYSVIVDATFLQQSRRQSFQALARRLSVPFVILAFTAPEAVLRSRVAQRLTDGADPSEASLEVLEAQLAAQEKLTDSEQSAAIGITPDAPLDLQQLKQRIKTQSGTPR